MSLFNLGGNQPASSGTSTTAAPALGSLFGASTTTTSSTPAPSLFSGLKLGTTSTTTAAPTQPAVSSAAGGSLFGGLGGAKTTAPAANPTLSLGSTLQPPSSTFGNSLFSKPATSQTTQPVSTNPLSNIGQPAQFGASSLFGATATQPQQQQQLQQTQSGGLLTQVSLGTGQSSHFDNLLERGRKRNAGENRLGSFDELPTLQFGLGDIARKVRNLGNGGPSADQVQDRAAHYLLSASGVKGDNTLRGLDSFTAQSRLNLADAGNHAFDTGIDDYLPNLQSQSTLALIQEGLEQSKRDFDDFLEQNLQIEWDKQRQKIYEHFGLGRQSEQLAASRHDMSSTAARGAFGKSTRKGRSTLGKSASASFAASAGPSVIGSVMSKYGNGNGNPNGDMSDRAMSGQNGPSDRHKRDKQEKFMETIKQLNEARLRENHFPLIHELIKVETITPGENSEHFANAYRALASITGESTPNNNVKERQLREEYLNDQPNSMKSVTNRRRILDGSRKFLENKFLAHVHEVLERNPQDARPGGAPSNINKIRGFIRAKMAQKELGVDLEHLQKLGGENSLDDYPWLIVFFLLRTGLTDDMVDYVREKRNFFQNIDRNFQPAVNQYASDADRRLTPEMLQKVNHVYAQRIRIAPTNDPYRLACYKIIGRCEISKRNLESVKESMDDWIWLQFNLAREGNRAEENAGDIFGLDEIRATTMEIGQRHFSNNDESAGGYGVFFYLAILAGLFEQGIKFLYEHNYVSAVHFAITLAYYGLLRVSNWSTSGSEILTHTTRQQPQLNFCRIVGVYTQDFRAPRPDAAAEYLILLCLNADLPGEAGKQQLDICHEALRELVLETREFSTLLGDVKFNGQPTPGLVQERASLIQLSNEDAFIHVITCEAAKVADNNGRTNDAVLLNHLAGEYDSVVAILNRALAEALSVELGQEPLRLEPLKPRLPTGATPQITGEVSSTSFSMLGTDDPMELAQKVIKLYDENPLWWRSVNQSNRNTLGILFQLNQAKKTIEHGGFTEALDRIQTLHILPLTSAGNLSDIRQHANSFSTHPQEIARNIGNVLLWCIACCSRHREVLLSGNYDDPTRQALADQLLQKAKDLMVFAGLIRYKLPPRVFETLAREGGGLGGL